MGIWLLDASVHAIFLRDETRLPQAIQKILHRQWWQGYGRYVVNLCGQVKIWVIGKTVFNCLNGLPDWRPPGWVYQPNAKDVCLDQNWPQLLEDCKSLGCCSGIGLSRTR